MKALEKDPQSYDLEFKKRFPEAEFIYDLIKSRIGHKGRVLEVGSGTGRLAIAIAKQGFEVTAIDVSDIMIEQGRNTADQESIGVEFITGNFISLPLFEHLKNSESFDFIISTFALSEFSPLQQTLFLKQVSLLLKEEGKCFLAVDTAPSSGIPKIVFSIKNFIRAQMSIFKDIPSTTPVKNIETKLASYFESTLLYKKKTIKLFEITKKSDDKTIPKEITNVESVLGQFPQLKTAYCIINGILTRKHVPPGVYKIGNPNKNSPVLVTANYYWTVNSVYNTLHRDDIDCFLLIIDSDGINVWCAAGGGHFTHTQILEAIQVFDLKDFIDHTSLILPQLSATGVDRKVLSKSGWKPIFGPIDIKNVKSFLQTFTKNSETAKIDFKIPFRTLMGIQHAFFISCVMFLPLLLILGLLAAIKIPLTLFWISVVIQLLILGVITNMLFIWVYPVFNFTSSFFKKGLFVAIINSIVTVLYLISEVKTNSLYTIIFWVALVTMVSLFIVLDLAGNTPYTNHLDVESDLTLFMVPAIILFLIAVLIPIISSEIKHLLF
jgi:ubiquinone/menaquinone biosynthesis C-methylase UbiE